MRALQKDTVREEEQRARKKRRRKLLTRGGAALLVVSVVAVVVGVLLSKSSGDSSSEPADLDALKIDKCSNGGEESDRYTELRSVIVQFDGNTTKTIDTTGSAHRSAVCWLSDVDELQLDPSDSTTEYEVVERFVLSLLYFHFSKGNPVVRNAFDLAGWSGNLPICRWDLVECNYGGNIIGLSLESFGLTGRLPSELALLSTLLHLDMDGNLLSGPIPSELWRMTQLKDLIIGYNQLTGTLSDELSGLVELERLNIGPNGITGSLPSLSALIQLSSLRIQGNIDIPLPFPDLSQASHLGKRFFWLMN
jgi:hypothetical protein